MSGNDKQAELAHKLECNMAKHIADAHKAVITPGTLGAGMAIKESSDTKSSYDDESITITGTIVIKVFRPEA